MVTEAECEGVQRLALEILLAGIRENRMPDTIAVLGRMQAGMEAQIECTADPRSRAIFADTRDFIAYLQLEIDPSSWTIH